MFVERRKFKRLSVLADVVYSKTGKSEEEITFTKNISPGGICLVTNEELKAGDILELKIALPVEEEKKIKLFGFLPFNVKKIFVKEKKVIAVIGRVIWVKSLGLADKSPEQRFDNGIEFINISDSDKEKINKYVMSVLE